MKYVMVSTRRLALFGDMAPIDERSKYKALVEEEIFDTLHFPSQ